MRAAAVSRAPRRTLVADPALHRIAVVTGVALVVVLLGAGVLWQRLACLRLGQEVRELERREASLAEERKQLEMERARLSSPERVQSVAELELGLVQPRPGQVKAIQ